MTFVAWETFFGNGGTGEDENSRKAAWPLSDFYRDRFRRLNDRPRRCTAPNLCSDIVELIPESASRVCSYTPVESDLVRLLPFRADALAKVLIRQAFHC